MAISYLISHIANSVMCAHQRGVGHRPGLRQTQTPYGLGLDADFFCNLPLCTIRDGLARMCESGHAGVDAVHRALVPHKQSEFVCRVCDQRDRHWRELQGYVLIKFSKVIINKLVFCDLY